MSDTLNLFVGIALGLNLLALASSRLPSIIRAAALQGMVLGLIPLLVERESGWLVWVVSGLTIAIKGFLIPGLLRRALRAAQIDREVGPILGFIPSLLLGAGATIGAVAMAGVMPLRPEHAASLLVPGSFATVGGAGVGASTAAFTAPSKPWLKGLPCHATLPSRPTTKAWGMPLTPYARLESLP